MKSYFFIPADHPKFYSKINEIKADEIIIDLEDAFNQSKTDIILNELKNLNEKEKYYVRPNIFGKPNGLEFLSNLFDLGFRKIIIPKFYSAEYLKRIEKFISNKILKEVIFILLVENAKALIELHETLIKTALNIKSIALGSQDFSNNTRIKHDLETLYYPRLQLSLIANANKIEAIDIASMNISNKKEYFRELDSGEKLGYDAKFLIHPIQLEFLNEFNEEVRKELIFAKEMISIFEKKGKPNIFKYKGRVVEKPHIDYYKNVIEKYENK